MSCAYYIKESYCSLCNIWVSQRINVDFLAYLRKDKQVISCSNSNGIFLWVP